MEGKLSMGEKNGAKSGERQGQTASLGIWGWDGHRLPEGRSCPPVLPPRAPGQPEANQDVGGTREERLHSIAFWEVVG